MRKIRRSLLALAVAFAISLAGLFASSGVAHAGTISENFQNAFASYMKKHKRIGSGDISITNLQCPAVPMWFVQNYTNFTYGNGHGKDVVKNLVNKNPGRGLSVTTTPKAPAVYSVAGRVKGWGASGTKAEGHTGVVLEVNGNKATVLHTSVSSENTEKLSKIEVFPFPFAGVTFVNLGSGYTDKSNLDGGAFTCSGKQFPAGQPSTLGHWGTLKVGQQLVSPNRLYRMVMQPDGNLVISSSCGPIWSSGTSGSGGDRAVFQADGNFGIYAGTKSVFHTATNGLSATRLGLQNDGNLGIYTSSGRAVWGALNGYLGHRLGAGYSLYAGEKMYSADRRFSLSLENGSLVTRQGTKVIWSSNTNGSGGNRAILQGDSNFGIYAGSKSVWHVGTNGTGATYAVLQNDGNLGIYTPGNKAVWGAFNGRMY
ncbi:MAG: hypothetical protein LBM23_10070 [Propionibacteriaceae bacterium]|jgi:hypothetical protein|nr:hypothetical protein [Propionibacteriaceae bacterium]